MPSWGYSIKGLDSDKTAKASGRDLRISPKAAREVCNMIKGMKLETAMKLLEEVITLKRAVSYKRHKKKVAHRKGLEKWCSGRYPIKTAKAILRILENVDSNALQKGLAFDKLRIIHASTLKAGKIRKYIPRAFGRATPYFQELTHVEIIVQEE